MRSNKISKFLISIIMVTIIILAIGQTAIYAAQKTENKTLTLSRTRWVKERKWIYRKNGICIKYRK